MTNVFLKPAPDMLVRDPVSFAPLKPEGEWKALSPFWSRRLRHGDVVEASPVADQVPAPRASKASPAERDTATD